MQRRWTDQLLLVSYMPLVRAVIMQSLPLFAGRQVGLLILARTGTSRGPSLDAGTRPLPREAGRAQFTSSSLNRETTVEVRKNLF